MIKPTAKQLRAGYELLRASPPFSGWGLPPVGRVVFVTKGVRRRRYRHEKKLFGQCYSPDGKRIHLYVAPHRRFHAVLSTLAHEMIHVHEFVNRLPERQRKGRYVHGPAFQQAADKVCASLGFPRGNF